MDWNDIFNKSMADEGRGEEKCSSQTLFGLLEDSSYLVDGGSQDLVAASSSSSSSNPQSNKYIGCDQQNLESSTYDDDEATSGNNNNNDPQMSTEQGRPLGTGGRSLGQEVPEQSITKEAVGERTANNNISAIHYATSVTPSIDETQVELQNEKRKREDLQQELAATQAKLAELRARLNAVRDVESSTTGEDDPSTSSGPSAPKRLKQSRPALSQSGTDSKGKKSRGPYLDWSKAQPKTAEDAQLNEDAQPKTDEDAQPNEDAQPKTLEDMLLEAVGIGRSEKINTVAFAEKTAKLITIDGECPPGNKLRDKINSLKRKYSGLIAKGKTENEDFAKLHAIFGSRPEGTTHDPANITPVDNTSQEVTSDVWIITIPLPLELQFQPL